jgi:hypothetical protein
MVGRFSAIIGPLLRAAEVDGLSLGRPIAIATLAIMALISFIIIERIDDCNQSSA